MGDAQFGMRAGIGVDDVRRNETRWDGLAFENGKAVPRPR